MKLDLPKPGTNLQEQAWHTVALSSHTNEDRRLLFSLVLYIFIRVCLKLAMYKVCNFVGFCKSGHIYGIVFLIDIINVVLVTWLVIILTN